MTATKIQPGDDLHLTSLMAPHSLNFVTGADRAALLAYGRDVFAAARGSKCLAQIEEPAGAAPAAGAGSADDLAELAMLNKLVELGTQAYGALAKSNSDDGPSGTAAYVRWQERRAEMGELIRAHKAPALEAPAALAGVPHGWKLVPEEPTREMLDAYVGADGRFHSGRADWAAMLAAAPQAPAKGLPYEPTSDMLIAGRECDPALPIETIRAIWWAMWRTAPQAPAAPWKDHLTARLVNDLRDCAIKYHGAGQLRERIAHIVVPLCDQLKGALAAPAAPAVDAETIEDAERFRAMAKAALTDDEVFERALDQHPDMGGDATIDDVRAMFDAAIAAQAKEGGEAA